MIRATSLLTASLSATPIHEAPHYWTATVNGVDAHNELYGPFKSPRAAEKFCSRIPSMYRCTVEPIIPPAEWLRKGAR